MKIKAWAVLVPVDTADFPGELRPYGNGAQWQYPIFPTLIEAQDWKKESKHDRGSIIRVEITDAVK